MMSHVCEQTFSFLQMQSCEEGSGFAQSKTISFPSCIYPTGLGLNGKRRHIKFKLLDILICGGESLEQVALRSCGYPIIGSGTYHVAKIKV